MVSCPTRTKNLEWYLTAVQSTSTTQELQNVIVDVVRPFMYNFPENFDSRRVGNPTDPKRKRFSKYSSDPYWDYVKNIHVLIDPVDNHSAIAGWEEGKPCFWGHGFLFLNPKVEGDFAFDRDPDAEPFKAEEGRN